MAKFHNPMGVAISSDGVFALMTDGNNHRVRRIALASGVVTTLAGSGLSSSADGIGTMASFSSPMGICISLDASFALVTDYSSARVRRIEIATGAVTTLAGSSSGYEDGAGSSAKFHTPNGVAISPDASFALVTDGGNNRVRLLTIPTGAVTTMAGTGVAGYMNGVGAAALFTFPLNVALSSDGSFALVTESQFVRRLVIATRMVTTMAGSGSTGFADGAGTFASFNYPSGVAISPDSTFALVSDGSNNRLRHISLATGVVTTLAGSSLGFADGVGTLAQFNQQRGVAIAPNGSYALIADYGNNRVRRAALASLCSAGFYCPAGSSSATQLMCSIGSYCPTGSNASNECPAGSFCSNPSTIATCLAGSYCPARSTAALLCYSGFYCPSGSLSPTQVACAPGYFCASGSAFNARGALDGQGMAVFVLTYFVYIVSINLFDVF